MGGCSGRFEDLEPQGSFQRGRLGPTPPALSRPHVAGVAFSKLKQKRKSLAISSESILAMIKLACLLPRQGYKDTKSKAAPWKASFPMNNTESLGLRATLVRLIQLRDWLHLWLYKQA